MESAAKDVRYLGVPMPLLPEAATFFFAQEGDKRVAVVRAMPELFGGGGILLPAGQGQGGRSYACGKSACAGAQERHDRPHASRSKEREPREAEASASRSFSLRNL
ncbi:MAG: hypothetical protein KM296_05260 [Brockia lithotrophica]|nr:hypothetical protein [Brockia lithotrophica]